MKKLFAEFLGTMVLVLCGCGAAVMNGGDASGTGVLTIATAFGLAVVAMVYTLGSISGSHLNPAVTLGVWLSGRMKFGAALSYMAAQVVGAVAGSALLYAITSSLGLWGTGANVYGEGLALGAFLAETLFTFIFVLVVLAATARRSHLRPFAGLVIGLTLILVHIVCIPITGTSVNPARSIGPALFAGGAALSQLWLFIAAPFAGAVVAAHVWCRLSRPNKLTKN